MRSWNWVEQGSSQPPWALEQDDVRVAGDFNHVLKGNPSTHGCQHIVEIVGVRAYHCGMATNAGIHCRRFGGERPARTRRRSPRRARGVTRHPPLRRSPATFGGSLMSRVGYCGPKPPARVGGRLGRRWEGLRHRVQRTSVQPGSEGASIENIQDWNGPAKNAEQRSGNPEPE